MTLIHCILNTLLLALTVAVAFTVSPAGAAPAAVSFPLTPSEGMDGFLYCVGGDTLFALSPEGGIQWKYAAEGPINSSPVVAPDGSLYIISGDRSLAAVNPDGSRKWMFANPVEFARAPALGSDGTLYIGGSSGIWAIHPDGTVKWKRHPEMMYLTGAAVASDGTVLFYSLSSSNLYAVDSEGKEKWRFILDAYLLAPPSLDYQGRIYLNTHTGLVVLNPSGTFRWSFPGISVNAPDQFRGAPVIGSDGSIYLARGNGDILTLSPEGLAVRSISTGITMQSGLVCGDDGMLYGCSMDGRLLCIDPAGGVFQAFETGANPLPAPALTSGGMACFGVSAGQPVWVKIAAAGYPDRAPWPCSGQNNCQTRRVDQPAHLGALEGMVATSGSGTPLPEIALRLMPGDYRTVSDSTGHFILMGLAPGMYRISAEAFGVLPAAKEDIQISAGKVAALRIELDRDRKWVKWKIPLGGLPGGSPALGVDGTVYSGDASGAIHALNPDGTRRWDCNTGNPVTSVTIGEEGALYFGSGMELWATDAAGQVRWRYVAGGTVSAPVVTRDGMVYFGCADGNLYAVDAKGSRTWTCSLNSCGICAPVIGMDGTIYAGSQEGMVFAIDSYGVLKWSHPAGAPVTGSPALGRDGCIYVCSTRKVWALDPAGQQRWVYTSESDITTGPIIGGDNTVYFGSTRGISAVSEGRLVWKYETNEEVTTVPAMGSDGIVYFGVRSGMFQAITFEGYPTWRLDTVGRPCLGVAIGPDGVVYFGTDAGTLHAVQTRSRGYGEDAGWPCFGRDNSHRATADPPLHAALLSGTVTGADQKVLSGIAIHLEPGNASAMTDSRGRYILYLAEPGIYAASASAPGWRPAAGKQVTLVADVRITLDFSLSREAVWIRWKRYIGVPAVVSGYPAIGNNGLLYACAGEKLTAIRSDGAVQWERDTGMAASNPVVSSGGTIYLCDGRTLCSFTGEGAEIVHREYANTAWYGGVIALAADSVMYIAANSFLKGTLYAVRSSGEGKWQLSIEGTDVPPAIGEDGTIYVGGRGSGLRAISPEGKEKWLYGVAFDWILAPPALGPDGTVYAVQQVGIIHAVNPNGTPKWSYRTNQEGMASPVIGPDNTVYYIDGRGILYALDSGGKLKWLYRDLAPGTTPALGADQILYAAGRGGALVALTTGGIKKWTCDMGCAIVSSPKIAPDGTIYLSCEDGCLYAVQTESRGYPEDRCWPCLYGNNRNTGQSVSPPETGVLAGVVRNRDSGKGIPNALVRVLPGDLVASTDGDGRFRISHLAPGTYTLHFSAFGFLSRVATRIITAGDETGETEAILSPEDYRLKWVFDAPRLEQNFSNAITTPVTLGLDGAVYFSTETNLFAVSPDGTQRWTRLSGNRNGAAAVSADGTLYIGEWGNRLFALRPDSTLVWSVSLPKDAEGGPAVGADGGIYVGMYQNVNALAPDGTLRWDFNADHVVTTPSIGPDGMIYGGTNLNTFFALDARGNLRWTAKGRGDSPAIGADGNVYARFGNELIGYSSAGEPVWSYTAGTGISSACAIDAAGTVYFGDSAGDLYAVSGDHFCKWKFRAAGEICSCPAIGADGTIYFGDSGGFFHALHPDGTVKWSYKTGGAITGSPAISPDGTVYIGSMDGFLYAFQTVSYGYQADAPWPCYAHDSQRTSRANAAAPPVTGVRDFGTPARFALFPNRPNPFNPSTTIPFALPVYGRVSLTVYNSVGEKVKTLYDGNLSAGNHTVEWNAAGCASGVYFCTLRAGKTVETGKMLLVR